MPDSMSMENAAVLSVTYITSLHALKDQGHVKPGEWVLVLGASGGVGSAAIEIAKALGAKVIAAASSDSKLEYCKSLGADYTINYDTEDLRERVKSITEGKGVDVVYDPVGDRYTEPAFRSL
jgi:NADPH2:quinone reductase